MLKIHMHVNFAKLAQIPEKNQLKSLLNQMAKDWKMPRSSLKLICFVIRYAKGKFHSPAIR